MIKDWVEELNDTGGGPYQDRTVQCGLPGRPASFTLIHQEREVPESGAMWFNGFQEDVDPEILNQFQQSHPQANIRLDSWKSKADVFASACRCMRERVQNDVAVNS